MWLKVLLRLLPRTAATRSKIIAAVWVSIWTRGGLEPEVVAVMLLGTVVGRTKALRIELNWFHNALFWLQQRCWNLVACLCGKLSHGGRV